MKIKRLIVLDQDDMRALTYVLAYNGYLVWTEKVYEKKSRRFRTEICFYQRNPRTLGVQQDTSPSTRVDKIYDEIDDHEYEDTDDFDDSDPSAATDIGKQLVKEVQQLTKATEELIENERQKATEEIIENEQ